MDAAGLIDKLSRQRVLVVGDVMLDRFIRGSVSRISPEAPVPVVSVERRSVHPGGAANVARNVAEISGEVDMVGRIGRDGNGRDLVELLEKEGVKTGGLVESATAVTSTKTRIVARQQQVVRFDEEVNEALTVADEAAVLKFLEGSEERYDCVIAEDYAKGLFTAGVVERLREIAAAGVTVTVDPCPRHPVVWSGFTAVKPNLGEACVAAGVDIQLREEDDPAAHAGLKELVGKLTGLWAPEHLVVTLGEHGMLYAAGDGVVHHVPALAHEVYDVSGAGDTAIAVFSLALAGGLGGEQATELANAAASRVVEKLGTATVTRAELAELLAVL